ncbi:MAG: type II toxin-antitoxin system VapC family toxin [Planctomycetes bacterium]|nr:type II toxin-antitoxin system VapC family toxin [Planctomycetota bacterium]
MILLDTDHLTLLKYTANPRCQALLARMKASDDQAIGTTIVSVEEQWRGWFAVIARHHRVHRQVKAYEELVELHAFLSSWTIVPFDERAADRFEHIRSSGVRIGSMDLKIASIALLHDALVLSANLQDFQKVPGLRVENWLI